MTPGAALATDTARRLWESAVGDAHTPEAIAAVADRLCMHMSVGLARWIGGHGYLALLDRAVGTARKKHPALGDLSFAGGNEPAIAEAIRVHGADEFVDALVSLVATLIALLGRIIGEEMAVRLVEQIGVPGAADGRRTGTIGAHDD